jgi:hypothetical protein
MVRGNRRFLERVLDFDGNGGVEEGQLGIERIDDAEILLLIIPFHLLQLYIYFFTDYIPIS